ncbi:NAD-dependent epimerase/dehydratase family protein [Geminicoccus harenae]|uniref:NAD-dependent epimerase/dehydratase family protein n=2 Tax=Geminicoccus harenae TaxID=2498453 RepID=UPI001C93EFBD|nr:SDR family oxidoreductase [Geminicoccus harenae]
MRIAITGAGGFIGRHLAAALPEAVPLSHREIPTLDGHHFDLVIHAGRSPGIGQADWLLADDAEYLLLRRLADSACRYLMLSSRAVYGPADGNALAPNHPTAPASAYGRNKLRLEQAGRDLLGERLGILRLSNVFGCEWPGRTTFFGTMLAGLAERGAIRFDMAGSTRRDFVPVAAAARTIASLARLGTRDPVLHVGSGIALPCAALAEAAIAGFGRGRLVATGPERDGFAFDVGRTVALTGIALDEAAVLGAARAVGRELAQLRG